MTEKKADQSKCRKISSILFFCILTSFFIIHYFTYRVWGSEKLQAAFYYVNTCASCEGDKEFYQIFQECISSEIKESMKLEPASYNVFLDSCREKYQEEVKRLEIPEGTELPVMVLGEQWYSGYDQIREGLKIAVSEGASQKIISNEITSTSEEIKSDEIMSEKIKSGANSTEHINGAEQKIPETSNKSDKKEVSLMKSIQDMPDPAVLLFTTNTCESCHKVKKWLEEEIQDTYVLEYNIIEDDCLELLKAMFRVFGVEEKNQQVPAVFFGDQWRTGDEEITKLTKEQLLYDSENKELLKKVKLAENEEGENGNRISIPMIAGAGLLAGLNPCSISMLLMLLTLILSEKRSIWKSGLLYLSGKYAAYFAIGMGIYLSASLVSEQVLDLAGQVIYRVAAVLFLAAGVLYGVDAIRVYHQNYGKVKTQLPVGMRRMNHRMIRKFAEKQGALWPLLIIILGMAVSVGEFFCTGQIYMATITYMMKDRISHVWILFLIYVTAMSLPACIMVLLIQRTRNTEAVSDFMLRHLGMIKILSAVLFLGFAFYFFFR